MLWSKKPTPAPPASEDIICEVLNAYMQHYYKQAKGQPDPSIDVAKAKIERANKIISEGRIGYSLCRIVQQLNDGRDFGSIIAHISKDNVPGNPRHDRTTIRLKHAGASYTVMFIDEGIPTWTDDDFNSYGTIELYIGEDLVCGIEASADQTRGFEYARWGFDRASAFTPGEWMRHIVEMGALLDAHNERTRAQFFDKLAVERAAKINL
jgi:hypothetical protein